MHVANEYFSLPLADGETLLTTRHGGWAILSDEEYRLFKSGEVNRDSELFRTLEKAGLILTPASLQIITRSLRIENNFLFLPTNYHVIAVTNKCNFNCVYCHPDANPQRDEMSEETAKKILDFIFAIPMAGGCEIVIEGGEPLLKWDLIKSICLEAKERAEKKKIDLRFSFTTNASLMTEAIARDLAELKIRPCVSLDGPRELHDEQRPFVGGGGSHKKVVYWFKKLKEDYKVQANAIPVITKISLKYGAKALIDEYLRLGQNSVFLKPFRASGRALEKFDELQMSAKEFFEFWRDGIEYLISLQKKGTRISELNTVYFVTNIFSPQRMSMCHRKPCGAGFSILSYNTDGTINGCDATRSQKFLDLGHVEIDDYLSIRKKALPLLSLSPDFLPLCSSCPFMAYCGVCLSDTFGRENDIYPKMPRSFDCQWQKMAYTYLFNKLSENKEDAQILRSWANLKTC